MEVIDEDDDQVDSIDPHTRPDDLDDDEEDAGEFEDDDPDEDEAAYARMTIDASGLGTRGGANASHPDESGSRGPRILRGARQDRADHLVRRSKVVT